MTRLTALIDQLISEAGTNNEMDNRPALHRARVALESEIERLVSNAKSDGFRMGAASINTSRRDE